MIPSEISLPLKTTMSSRMRTIWPMTALNPISVRAVLTADAGLLRADCLDGLHRCFHQNGIRT